GAVSGDTFAHRLDISGPGHAEESRVMHQELPIRTENVDQPNIARGERTAFLTGQLILIEQSLEVSADSSLDARVAIDVVQELLQLIQAHDDVRRPGRESGTPARDVMRAEAHTDVLGLEEHLIAPGTSLPTDARRLGAAEGLAQVAHVLAVDETH